jgi:Fic family protein
VLGDRKMTIIAPTRMEPARIEDPGMELSRLCASLRRATAELEDMVPLEGRKSLSSAISAVSAFHSSRVEGRSPDPEEFLRLVLDQGSADASEESRECISLLGMHEDVHSEAYAESMEPSAEAWLLERHARFAKAAPWTAGAQMPGTFRNVDVQVGMHVPPPHDRISAFMDHFYRRYRQDWLQGDVTKVLAVATSHHRLAYIHPFEDGNGRLARLYSSAMAQRAGIASGGLWSLPRALACTAGGVDEYHRKMSLADRPRQGDRDGRGNLSLAALESFTTWFLEACLAEVDRMRDVYSRDTTWAPGGRSKEEGFLRTLLLM